MHTCWDTPSESTGVWQYYQKCPCLLRTQVSGPGLKPTLLIRNTQEFESVILIGSATTRHSYNHVCEMYLHQLLEVQSSQSARYRVPRHYRCPQGRNHYSLAEVSPMHPANS